MLKSASASSKEVNSRSERSLPSSRKDDSLRIQGRNCKKREWGGRITIPIKRKRTKRRRRRKRKRKKKKRKKKT